MDRKFRIAVLASGGGTNLQSIIDQSRSGRLNVEIALVFSNNPGAGALKRAEDAGIATSCINHRDFLDRKSFDEKVVEVLKSVEPDLIVLAGYMRIISGVFLKAFPQRIINIHPSLLPAFPGLHVQKKAIDYGARFSGCTVHLVDDGVDTGPIILQAVVPIHADDSEETLSARILEQEHKIYPQAIQWFAEGRVVIEERRVTITSAVHPNSSMINPRDKD